MDSTKNTKTNKNKTNDDSESEPVINKPAIVDAEIAQFSIMSVSPQGSVHKGKLQAFRKFYAPWQRVCFMLACATKDTFSNGEVLNHKRRARFLR